MKVSSLILSTLKKGAAGSSEITVTFYHFDGLGTLETAVNMDRRENPKSHPFLCIRFSSTDTDYVNIWLVLLLAVEKFGSVHAIDNQHKYINSH